MRAILRLFFFSVLATLLSTTSLCAQQSVEIDWSTKKLTSQPSQINTNTNVKINVSAVNDVLYTYSITSQSVPTQIDDFSQIQNAFKVAGQAAKGATGEAAICDVNDFLKSVKSLLDAENAVLQLPATTTGCSVTAPCSVSLADTNAAWLKSVPALLTVAKSKQADSQRLCSASVYQPAYASSQATLDAATSIGDSLANTIHLAQSQTLLKPDYTTSVEVDEFWKGKATVKGQYTVTLSNTNTRLTLSAGALFSQLQNRTYTTVPAPNSSGTGTTNVLAVSGRSTYSPLAVALLNYEIPKLSNEYLGLAISTGPVLRINSASSASSFGYFAGIGIHLYHRFYVSPGFNLGQFADNPPGLSSGSVVPSGIGTPAPINRWTWRFGFAVTYKAKDFSALGLTTTVAPKAVTGDTTPPPPAVAPKK